MAKEDEILKSFMAHPLLKEEYGLSDDDLPQTIEAGMKSNVPIILAISNIVKNIQRKQVNSDNELQRQVFEILNKKIV